MTRTSQLAILLPHGLLLVTLVASVAFADAPTPTDERPNILFILADDLGWGDPSCYGNRFYKTPSLDRLANEGTRFTQFYVAGSVCSPSRAAFLTSRFPAELRLHGHLSTKESNRQRDMPDYLSPDVPTVAHRLRDAGYETAHVGKWHLGLPPEARRDFSAYGFDRHGLNDVIGGDNLWSTEGQHVVTRRMADSVIDLLQSRSGKPFYIQWWLTAPHAPLNPSPEQMKPFEKLQGKYADSVPFKAPAVVFAASVAEMDRQIGRVLDKLDELKIADNTIVVFSSDNGPEDMQIQNASWSAAGTTGMLRGRKRSLYDGGIRVPFLVRWPKKIPAGRVNETSVVSGVDFHPTLASLTNTTLGDDQLLRGEDMSDVWLGSDRPRKTTLFWQWRFEIVGHPSNVSPQLALREGNWSFLMNPDGSRVELYDMSRSPMQLDNIADTHPEVVESLTAKLLAWNRTLPKRQNKQNPRKSDVSVTSSSPSTPLIRAK